MNKSEAKELQDLKDEVESLKSEVQSLREFVKALYSMLDEGEQYEGGEQPCVDFRGINT